MRDHITLYVNGKKHKLSGEQVFQSLSDFLRYEAQLVGTKVVCAEGDCGSCTISLGTFDGEKVDYNIVNSCIKYMYQLDCTHIITVEGLKINGELNPIQKSMVKNHGAQCGFCTPGFVVAMTDMYDKKYRLEKDEIVHGLTGNLCRCTGYEPIIKAGLDVDTQEFKHFKDLYLSENMIETFKKSSQEEILIETEGNKFFKPLSFDSACKFKNENKSVTPISGGSDICVLMNKGRKDPKVIMTTTAISGNSEITNNNDVLEVGAKVTLRQLEFYVKDLIPELNQILRWFGSPQIRNAGTLAGNIANASPIADTIPFLMVTDSELELTGVNGSRKVKINDFYQGYKQFDLKEDELISKVFIPVPKKSETLKLYKVSKRKDLDISTFTAAMKMELENNTVKNINLAYGGVGPIVLRLPKTEAFFVGKEFTEENIKEAGKIARSEITPISDVRSTKDYRLLLAETILLRFYFECQEESLVNA